MAATEAEERLAQIAAEVQVCTKCPLYQGARMGVPGSGDGEVHRNRRRRPYRRCLSMTGLEVGGKVARW